MRVLDKQEAQKGKKKRNRSGGGRVEVERCERNTF